MPPRLPRFLQPVGLAFRGTRGRARRRARQPRRPAGTSAARSGASASACTGPTACCTRGSASAPRVRRVPRVSWDEALALVADAMREARDRWGGESVLPYYYGGSNGLLTQDTTDARLFRRFGASRLARTLCAATTGAANQALYGKMPSSPTTTTRTRSSSSSGARTRRRPASTSCPFIREARARGAEARRRRSARDAARPAGRSPPRRSGRAPTSPSRSRCIAICSRTAAPTTRSSRRTPPAPAQLRARARQWTFERAADDRRASSRGAIASAGRAVRRGARRR